ncbi:MAG: hypothetical protein KME08_04415 [Aphanothece sp. CMT-3BRIN-NPC111]|nr:hypothetical protein [Aphanothece sp. CMT-3BRIN-NPC111]
MSFDERILDFGFWIIPQTVNRGLKTFSIFGQQLGINSKLTHSVGAGDSDESGVETEESLTKPAPTTQNSKLKTQNYLPPTLLQLTIYGS